MVKVSSQIVNELRRLAAFQCQIFVFTLSENAVCEQCYGYEGKNIKGACQHLIDGDNAFNFLYDIIKGENGLERVLKPMFCGKQSTSAFVAGVDITPVMLGRDKNGTGTEMTG